MATPAKLTFAEFIKLQGDADETVRYELDEREPISTPSPTPWHQVVCFRLRRTLAAFVETNGLGMVIGEVDFRLSANTVRKPDIAVVGKQQLERLDLHRTPIQGAPLLAVEIISPSNFAQDTFKKIRQYLGAGSDAVWLVYPDLKTIEIHDREGTREISGRDVYEERRLFPKLTFSLSLTALFDENPERN